MSALSRYVSVPLRGINCNFIEEHFGPLVSRFRPLTGYKLQWQRLLKNAPKIERNPQPEPFHLYYRCIPPRRKGFFPKNLKNSGANRSKISRADGSLKWGSHSKVGNCLAGPQNQTSLILSPPLQTALPFTLPKPMNPGELRRAEKIILASKLAPPSPKAKRPFHKAVSPANNRTPPKAPTKEPNPTHEKLQKVLT